MRLITLRQLGICMVVALLLGVVSTALAAPPRSDSALPASVPQAVVHAAAASVPQAAAQAPISMPQAVVPQAIAGCHLAQPQPGMPLQMNTVAAGGLFKTVAMEKEIFNCIDTTGALAQIRDVETFLEVVENGPNLVEIRPEIATCIKSFVNFQIHCRTAPLVLGKTATPLLGCNPSSESAPFAPVIMNTVLSGIVKTIKVEKEIFQCVNTAGTAPSIGDVYVFTEIDEARTTLPSGVVTYRPTAHKFMGVVCYKQESTATVTACNQFNP